MSKIIRPLFSYLRAAIRSRDPTRRRGQSLVEYALILSIISIVLVGVIVNLGTQIKGVYSTVTSQLAYASSSH